MIHPDTRLAGISPEIGVGVVATRPIPAGTLVWVQDPLDLRLDAQAVEQLPRQVSEQFTRHAYLDSEDQWMMCWDIARYVNHHCDYNCAVTPWGAEIACRDIAAGDELSNDYALFQLAEHEEFDCRCTASLCRQRIDSRNAERHRSLHDQRLAQALKLVMRVDQPLWPLLTRIQTQTLLEASGNAA